MRRRRCPSLLLLCFHLQSIVLFLFAVICVSYGSENTTASTVELIVSSTHGLETISSRFDDHFNIDAANEEDLNIYKLYLEARLEKVKKAQKQAPNGTVKAPKSKRFIPLPISASLPDHGSDYVRSRVAVVAKQSDESENEPDEQKLKEGSDAEKPINIVESTSPPDANESWTYVNNSTELEVTTTGSGDSKIPQDGEDNTKESKSLQDNANDENKNNAENTEENEINNQSKPAENIPQEDPKAELPKASEAQRSHIHHPKAFASSTVHFSRSEPFNPTQNHTAEECKQLSQRELVKELKQKGTYNPDLMAWDATGVFRFLDRSILDQYDRQAKAQTSNQQAVERNILALERILSELNLKCQVRSPEVLSKISNLTVFEPRRTVVSPSLRMNDEEITRFKRNSADDLLKTFNLSRSQDSTDENHQKLVGEVHVVPFGCDKRGEREDGYLRLCGACQAIRKLPDSFFPPFINEVMCDEDKSCLYFYDYPHGKCKQKHMNFVVLRNVGTPQCQVWQKFNLNVRVSCECFVDEMSFFSKYV
ncbi:unnamed protein product [Bursaphelenchus okinawaensis]|uniref:Spaetzle domain-containing protein n=1 Tax=Bursaphelenchus okinawaensis TaxID=465554 RepID=A0A811KEU6_9BILA|nr:unnamed protein product [Bursaphelenchus okinawaensis]CAG9103333.1 unnamed protein product [Bursaphelenchus okinawaensis]